MLLATKRKVASLLRWNWNFVVVVAWRKVYRAQRRSWKESSKSRKNDVGFTKDYRAIPAIVTVGGDRWARWDNTREKTLSRSLLPNPRKKNVELVIINIFNWAELLSINSRNLADIQARSMMNMPTEEMNLHWTKKKHSQLENFILFSSVETMQKFFPSNTRQNRSFNLSLFMLDEVSNHYWK